MLDDRIHDLVGAGPDGDQARIAQQALDGIDAGVADAAHDLHGVVDHLPGGVGGKLFGFRDHAAEAPRFVAGVYGPRGGIYQAAGGVQQDDALGHLEADRLVGADLLAEGFAPVAVAGGNLQGGARHAQGAGGAGHALGDHHLVKDLAGAVLAANQVGSRDAHIAEIHPPRAAAARAHQAVDVLHLHARPALHDEGADRPVRVGLRSARAGIDQEKVCPLRADDEALLPVQYVIVAIAARRGGSAEEIRPAARLGERLGHGEAAFHRRAQPALFLLGRAKDVERFAHDADQAVQAAQRGAQHAHLFEGDDLIRPGQAAPAVFGRETQAQQAAGGGALQELARVVQALGVHIQDQLARYILAHEGAQLVAQLALRVSQQGFDHRTLLCDQGLRMIGK